MLRVLTLDRDPSSKNGGQEWSLLDECVGLASRGHKVTLGFLNRGDLLARHAAAGVRLLPLDEVDVTPNDRLRAGVRVGRSIWRAAREKLDVVCVNQYHDTLFGRGVAALAGVPLVCHLRLTPPDEFCTQWRLGVNGVARFIAVSQTVKDAWVRDVGLAPGKIDVVFDGIDLERFRPMDNRDEVRRSLGIPHDAFLVVYAGRIDAVKNIGLKSLATTLSVAEQIHWLGARQDVPELLSAGDAAALFAYEEPFGRATIEALACGVPIAAHRAGGTAEILTGEFARFAFGLDDPMESVAVLRSLVHFREADPGFAARARAHVVEHFSARSMVNGIERSLMETVRAA
jgi:glycosyltransferase involved in cell wall biosynthesis